MANEFQHKDPGATMTQAEYITTDGTGHIFDSQAQGDILYASSSTVLSRLPKSGTTTHALLNSGTSNNPEWAQIPLASAVSGQLPIANGGTGASSASAAATALGLGTASNPQFATIELGAAADTTIARASAGNLTTVPVADGGTGASSLTDGGVLLGNGTGAVVAMAVLADGEMIVGDGTTDPVPESGATLRTSVGVGTGDTPQFTGINVGHASDSTLTRGAAGLLEVEGVRLVTVSATQTLTNKTLSGNTTISDGNLVIGTADKGIDFSNQTSPAAGMTSELLDRYEEGTWTAKIQGSTGSEGSPAYVGQGNVYTRIGRMVTVYTSIRATSMGSWTGTMRIAGLPFTNGGIGAAGSIGMLSSSALDATVRACHIPASAAYIEFKAGSYLDGGMNLSEYSTSYNTQVNVTYFV